MSLTLYDIALLILGVIGILGILWVLFTPTLKDADKK